MSLQIEPREIEGITVLVVEGDLILGSEATTLQENLHKLIEDGKIKVILDLEAAPYIDSTGLGVLISGHTAFKGAGGALKLLHLSPKNLELLVLTKLNLVFETFTDEQTAINSFFPDREVRRFDILEFVRSQENEDEKPEVGQETAPDAREAAPVESSSPQAEAGN